MRLLHAVLLGSPLAFCLAFTAHASAPVTEANAYKQTVFVANKAKYKPTLATDKNFINAWGIAIRPKGAGGHFWITAKDISYEYVGDVQASADPKLRRIHQDDLKIVTLPLGGDDKFSTSTVFSNSDKNFIITQKLNDGTSITAPTKFFFSSDGGVISAWTEKKNDDGSFQRSDEALSVIDQSKDGAQFFGIAVDHKSSRLYAADFGAAPSMKVFDKKFKPTKLTFDMPFDENKNGTVDAGEYAPFNVQAFTTPAGDHRIFVTYAKTQACPTNEVKKGTCKKGEIFAGEEDTSQPGYGRLAEFDEDGELVAVWNDNGKLSAPWGLAFAPNNFGALSGKLLVGNFGNGEIVAFDPETKAPVDVLQNAKGKPLVIDKLWGLLFGNGESLGDANALYFTAGPDDEKDGIFGSIRSIQ